MEFGQLQDQFYGSLNLKDLHIKNVYVSIFYGKLANDFIVQNDKCR